MEACVVVEYPPPLCPTNNGGNTSRGTRYPAHSVMVANRGPVVEGHHSLTTYCTKPANNKRYITAAPHFHKPFTSNRGSGARYLIKYLTT